jgi:hypothetical protein
MLYPKGHGIRAEAEMSEQEAATAASRKRGGTVRSEQRAKERLREVKPSKSAGSQVKVARGKRGA